MTANILKSKLADQQGVVGSVAVAQGGDALRVYLATRMDEPIANYLRPEQNPADFASENANMTFVDAIPLILQDGACVKALQRYGRSYTNYSALAQAMTPGLCRAFLVRTIYFFQPFVGDNFVLQISGGGQQVLIGRGILAAYKKSILSSADGYTDDYTLDVEQPILAGGSATSSSLAPTPDNLVPGTVLFIGSQALPGNTSFTLTLLAAQVGGLS